MATKLDDAVKRMTVADVKFSGEALVLPERMGIDAAIDLLKRRKEYEALEVIVQDEFDTFPWDGAVALQRVLKRRFGWAEAVATPSFFGDSPPAMLPVEVGPGNVIHVPWGRFTLPTIASGFIETGTKQNKKGRTVLALAGKVKRMHEQYVRDLFDELRREIKEHSIYRGKAVKVQFTDNDGDALSMPIVSFMDTSGIGEHQLVFSRDLQAAVETNLFTPIRRAVDCIANGIPLKRGVLLGGAYGCGKTLAAVVASRIAVDNGITFVYVEKAADLGLAVEFAKQYQSPAAAVFCEDIDRSMSGDRSEDMDTILNIIDGIESKKNNVIVVLTTNALDSINAAMIRPGRLDAVIDITPPNAEAVQRLLRLYGGNAIAPEADLAAVGFELSGNIPAVIAEVVKRAKLSQLSLQARGTVVSELSPAALLEAARTMTRQIALLNKPAAPPAPALESSLAAVLHKTLNNGAKDGLLHRLDERLERVVRAVT